MENDVKSSVSLNGFFISIFSPLLYILLAETLANKVGSTGVLGDKRRGKRSKIKLADYKFFI